MTASHDPKLEAFLDELCAKPEAAIDYVNAPKTTAEDWKDAEVLLPVSRDEFKAIERFLEALRARTPNNPGTHTTAS
jgi:hypothetical protein